MLRVGSVASFSEGEQPSAFQEPLRHFVTSRCKLRRLSLDERRVKYVAHQERCLCAGRERGLAGQHIRGSGSPTSISITRVPPYEVVPSTVPAGCSRISPIITASTPMASS